MRLALAGTPAGGSTLTWLSTLLGIGDTAQLTNGLAAHDTSVIALPHFLGSRVAFNDPTAAGAFVGLRFDTGRRDITLALLNAVAYELAVILDHFQTAGVRIATLRAVGGGSCSDDWMQIIADVTDLPVQSTHSGYGAAIGAAAIAAQSTGILRADSPTPTLPIRSSYEPRPERAERHAARRTAFCQLHAALEAAEVTDPDLSMALAAAGAGSRDR
jgi:xylulokinase